MKNTAHFLSCKGVRRLDVFMPSWLCTVIWYMALYWLAQIPSTRHHVAEEGSFPHHRCQNLIFAF